MVVQEIAYAVQDQNQTIAIISKESKSKVDANAYLLRRMLCTVEHISADNIEITVSENDFEGIKKHLNK